MASNEPIKQYNVGTGEWEGIKAGALSDVNGENVVTAAEVAQIRDSIGEPNGIPTMDENKKILKNQIPTLDYIPLSQKGVVGGVASYANLQNAVAVSGEPNENNIIFNKPRTYDASEKVSPNTWRTDFNQSFSLPKGMKKLKFVITNVYSDNGSGGWSRISGCRVYLNGSQVFQDLLDNTTGYTFEVNVSHLAPSNAMIRIDYRNYGNESTRPGASAKIMGNETFTIAI